MQADKHCNILRMQSTRARRAVSARFGLVAKAMKIGHRVSLGFPQKLS